MLKEREDIERLKSIMYFISSLSQTMGGCEICGRNRLSGNCGNCGDCECLQKIINDRIEEANKIFAEYNKTKYFLDAHHDKMCYLSKIINYFETYRNNLRNIIHDFYAEYCEGVRYLENDFYYRSPGHKYAYMDYKMATDRFYFGANPSEERCGTFDEIKKICVVGDILFLRHSEYFLKILGFCEKTVKCLKLTLNKELKQKYNFNYCYDIKTNEGKKYTLTKKIMNQPIFKYDTSCIEQYIMI